MAHFSGFADEISPSVSEQIRVLKKLGIPSVEVRGVDGRNLSELSLEETRQLHEKLSDNGITVSALGSPLGKIKLTDDFSEHLKLFDHMMDQAHILETKYVRMFSFYGADDSPEAENQVFDRLDQFMDHTPSDLTLLHENEHAIFGNTGIRCLKIMQRYAPSGMRATFDPSNFILEGEQTLPCFDMLKPYIAYMHIKDAVYEKRQIVPAGMGDGHFPELLRRLKETGFDGYYSIEPHLVHFTGYKNLGTRGSDVNGMSDKAEGEERFTLAFETFKSLMQKENML